jgi:hypothetical protein
MPCPDVQSVLMIVTITTNMPRNVVTSFRLPQSEREVLDSNLEWGEKLSCMRYLLFPSVCPTKCVEPE